MLRQNASEEMTSPFAFVPTAHQVCALVELFTNLTLPSANKTFTPPACRLEALYAPGPALPLYTQFLPLGGMTCV